MNIGTRSCFSWLHGTGLGAAAERGRVQFFTALGEQCNER